MRDEDAKKEERKFEEENSKRKNIKFTVDFNTELTDPKDIEFKVGEPVLKKEDKVEIINVKKEANKHKDKKQKGLF